jgi:hypothetical protein
MFVGSFTVHSSVLRLCPTWRFTLHMSDPVGVKVTSGAKCRWIVDAPSFSPVGEMDLDAMAPNAMRIGARSHLSRHLVTDRVRAWPQHAHLTQLRTPRSELRLRTPSSELRAPTPSSELRTPTPNSELRAPTPSSELRTPTPNSELRLRAPNSELRLRTPAPGPRSERGGGAVEPDRTSLTLCQRLGQVQLRSECKRSGGVRCPEQCHCGEEPGAPVASRRIAIDLEPASGVPGAVKGERARRCLVHGHPGLLFVCGELARRVARSKRVPLRGGFR